MKIPVSKVHSFSVKDSDFKGQKTVKTVKDYCDQHDIKFSAVVVKGLELYVKEKQL